MSIIERFLPFIILMYTVEVIVSITISIYLAVQIFQQYRRGYTNIFFILLGMFMFFFGINFVMLLIIEVAAAPHFYDKIPVYVWLIWLASHVGLMITIAYVGFFIISESLTLNVIKKKDKR